MKGLGFSEGFRILFEDVVGEEDFIFYLVGRVSGNLYVVFILLFYLVSYVIFFGDVIFIVDLEVE